MSSDVRVEWFSAANLADLTNSGVIKLARSERRAGEKAKRLGWEHRTVPGQGGKDGLRNEYKPPQDVIDAIHYFITNDKKDVYTSPSNLAPPVVKVGHTKYEAVEESKPRPPVKPKPYVDTLYIQQLNDVRAAAGNGQVTPTDQVSVMVAINAIDWRNRVGANPDKVKIITVYGDSMEGTLSHGDQVFVDTACNKFIDDAIYVIMQAGLLRIKRVKLKLDGSILVKSDNENGFGVEEYSANQAAEFNVVGKVLPFKFGQFKM